MERKPLESSYLKSVGYDPDTLVLEVEFSNGGIYQYANVPAEVHSGLMEAESAGKYFGAKVRGQFTAKKKEEGNAAATLPGEKAVPETR